MMVHRKSEHPNRVRTCRNFEENKCQFSDIKCWWNHKLNNNASEEVKCFICEEKFVNKRMMSHRKKKHIEIVRQCVQFEQNNCRFQAEFCWFKHENSKQIQEQSNRQMSVFQKVSGNLKPPIEGQKTGASIL